METGPMKRFLNKYDTNLLWLALMLLALFVLCIGRGLTLGQAAFVAVSGLVISLVLGHLRWRRDVIKQRAWLAMAEDGLKRSEKVLADLTEVGKSPAPEGFTWPLAESIETAREELRKARERLYKRQPYLPRFLQVGE